MKKLKLDPDALRVDTFQATGGDDEKQGTVHGHATLLCTRYASCYGSCPGTCNLDSCDSCTQGYSCWTCPAC